jgi:integrase
MVLVAGSTGMRRSELIALVWKDINFALRQVNITRSIYRNKTWICKTVASRRPVPLHPFVMEQLLEWRRRSEYSDDNDFLFPSVKDNGAHPIAPDMVLRRHIRPALKDLGIQKRIGWHSFRHGLGTMLRQQGVDLKTAQELLRHANARTTMELYQQAISSEKRAANAVAVRGLLGDFVLQHPSAPQEEV